MWQDQKLTDLNNKYKDLFTITDSDIESCRIMNVGHNVLYYKSENAINIRTGSIQSYNVSSAETGDIGAYNSVVIPFSKMERVVEQDDKFFLLVLKYKLINQLIEANLPVTSKNIKFTDSLGVVFRPIDNIAGYELRVFMV